MCQLRRRDGKSDNFEALLTLKSSRLTAQPVSRLIDELAKLPGVGPKTASRLAFHLLRGSREDSTALAEAILEVKEKIRLCPICFNITESIPCGICTDLE